MKIEDVVSICKALGDENRIRIVQMLIDGEMCACDLLEKLKITQPTLSHHMKILTQIQLVNVRKDGRWMHYSINCDAWKNFRDFIESVSCK